MKKLLGVFIVGILFFLVGCASMGGVTESVDYSEIIDVQGVNAGDLYTRVNMWFVDAFRSADSVIQFSDKESGVVKGKYVSAENIVHATDYYRISSTITVEVKDERYRISFSDPKCRPIGSVLGGNYNGQVYPERNLVNQDMAEKVKESWAVLAGQLKNSVSIQQTDW
jgi:hypothetical protein